MNNLLWDGLAYSEQLLLDESLQHVLVTNAPTAALNEVSLLG